MFNWTAEFAYGDACSASNAVGDGAEQGVLANGTSELHCYFGALFGDFVLF